MYVCLVEKKEMIGEKRIGDARKVMIHKMPKKRNVSNCAKSRNDEHKNKKH